MSPVHNERKESGCAARDHSVDHDRTHDCAIPWLGDGHLRSSVEGKEAKQQNEAAQSCELNDRMTEFKKAPSPFSTSKHTHTHTHGIIANATEFGIAAARFSPGWETG